MKNNRKAFFITVFLLCFYTTYSFSQKNYKWDKKVKESPAIPEIFSDADAVMIYYKETRETLLDDNRIFSRNIVKQKIKILTESGLKKYARIILPKKKGMKSSILDARTIKQDGSIVNLDAKKEIKSLEFTDADDFLDKSQYEIFSIPGVAVGDEVEIVAIRDGYTVERGAVVIPHKFIPILDLTFTVRSKHKDIGVDAINVNNMSMPQVVNYGDGTRVMWRIKNLHGLYEEIGNISAISLPHFIYELNFDRLYTDSAPPNIKSWKDLLHYANKEIYNVKIRKKGEFNKLFSQIISQANSESILDKLSAIQEYINEVDIVTLNSKEENKGLMYFLAEKKGDYATIIKMYKALLSQLEIDFRFGVGRAKYLGPIHLNFPSFFQISDFIFLVPEDSGYIVLPIKSANRKFKINEIPVHLNDTKIHMISPGNKNLFRSTTLRGYTQKDNIQQRDHIASVSLESGKISYKRTESLSGALSTKYRNDHLDLMESNSMEEYLNSSLDDLLSTNVDSFDVSKPEQDFPFAYRLLFDFKTTNQIIQLDEKVYKIDLSNLLNHRLQKANENRLLDYYPPFRYSDGFSYEFKFESPINLVNKNNIDRTVSNNAGSFQISAEQVDSNTIILTSTYIIKQGKIKKEDIQNLLAITEEAMKADNEGLIVEVE